MNTKTDKKTPFFLRIPVLWCAFLRLFWVFYDPNTFFLGGAKGLFVISIAVSALAAAVLALRLYVPAVKGKPTENSKVLCVLGGIAFVLGVIFFVADIVLFILSGAEAAQPIFLNFKKDLPFTVPVLAVAVAVLALPRLKGKGRAVLALCMAACILASSLWALFPMHAYRFESDPVVMDTGLCSLHLRRKNLHRVCANARQAHRRPPHSQCAHTLCPFKGKPLYRRQYPCDRRIRLRQPAWRHHYFPCIYLTGE